MRKSKIYFSILFLFSLISIGHAQTNLFTAANVANTYYIPAPFTNPASNALYDGLVTTFANYVAPAGQVRNIIVKLKVPTRIQYFSLSSTTVAFSPSQITLSGSNDSTTWTTLTTKTGNAETITTQFINTTSYLYYRFALTPYSSTSLYMRPTEIAAYTTPPPPSVPTLTATALTVGTTVRLNWTATTTTNTAFFSGYEIQRSMDGVNFSPLVNVTAPTIAYTDSTTKQSTSYWYRIRARVDTLFSAYSTIKKVTTASDILDVAPTLNVSLRKGYFIPLDWNQIMLTPGSYELYKSNDSINFTLLATVDKFSRSYSDTITDTTKSYFYKVRGVNYISNSPYSNIVKVSDSLTASPTIVAANPGEIGSAANIVWLNYSDNKVYQTKIERSTDSINFTQVAILPQTEQVYNDTSLTNAKKYFYRIRMFNILGNSPYSNIIQVTTVNDTLKNVPVLTAASSTGTQANLAWADAFNTPVGGGYEIEQSSDGVNFISLGKVDKTITSYQVQSLNLNTKYYFRIRAYNYNSKSPYSNIATTTTNNISATADITYDGGNLYVNAENQSGGVTSADNAEGSSKLIDHSISTKFLVFTDQLSGTLNCIYKPTGKYIVSSYAIGTAGDAPERDPKDWTFSGSNDSTNWVVLDTRTEQLGDVPRFTYFNYSIANPGTVAYKYYRLSITENNGGSNVRFQIAEWPIYGTPTSAPNIPQSFKVTDSTASSLSLGWTQDVSDTSRHLTNFVLQRGLDRLNFTTVNSRLPLSARSFVDQGLLDSTVYYYRIQAVDSIKSVYTGWSSIAAGMTKVTPGIPHVPILSLGTISDSTISIRWTNRATNATGFKIERSTDGINFVQIDSVSSNITSYTNYPVWAAYQYYYRIRAYNSNGNSSYSNTVSTFTTGFNRAPMTSTPVIYRKVCAAAGKYSFSIGGIVPGPNFERTQSIKVVKVTADSLSLFSGFGFDSTVTNGVVNYSFTTNNTVVPGDTATILVTVRDNGGILNSGTDSLIIPVKIYFTPLTLTVTADKNINNVPRYALVTLTASTSEPATTSYNWTSTNSDDIVGASNLLKLQLRPLRTETITVTATSTQGCTATTSIVVKPQDSLVVSNILTPNGDGINDKWIVWGIENMTNNSVKVVDRSGRVVFTQTNYQNGWDGKYNGNYLPEGAYFYIVDYNVPNGSGGTSKIQSKGVLTIIRNR